MHVLIWDIYSSLVHLEIDVPLYPNALMHMGHICVPLRLEVTPLIYPKDTEDA